MTTPLTPQQVPDFSATHVECDICGEMVERGIVNYVGHWTEKHGKAQMDFVNKVADSPLTTEDKMSLIKKEFNILH